MKFTIWQSVRYQDAAFGYKPGVLMKHVWEGEVTDWSPDLHVTQVLDRIWIRFQRVDENHMPPDGYEGRSLSIGDVIQLAAEDDDAVQVWYTPGSPVGWEEVPPIENMACPECESEWPVAERFCPSCGMSIEEIAEIARHG